MRSCVFFTESERDTKALGKKLARFLMPSDVLSLEGDLGAGKTTFTQGIAEGLGILQAVNSPTFSLIKEYRGRIPLYHMDVYRLQETQEDELGLQEYFYGDGICVVEWPCRVRSLLPETTINLEFRAEDEKRKISLFPPLSRDDLCRGLLQ